MQLMTGTVAMTNTWKTPNDYHLPNIQLQTICVITYSGKIFLTDTYSIFSSSFHQFGPDIWICFVHLCIIIITGTKFDSFIALITSMDFVQILCEVFLKYISMSKSLSKRNLHSAIMLQLFVHPRIPLHVFSYSLISNLNN